MSETTFLAGLMFGCIGLLMLLQSYVMLELARVANADRRTALTLLAVFGIVAALMCVVFGTWLSKPPPPSRPPSIELPTQEV